jgi:methylmalonyl-CoA mutase C-terminal domain/subunit
MAPTNFLVELGEVMTRKIRVLLAKLGLDVHNRGIITVGKELVNSNMEVIYIGNALPKEIIQTAIQEDVDIIGISSLAGAHLTLGSYLIELSKSENIINNTVIVIGGVFPPIDGIRLKTIGFDDIFTPGSTGTEIVNSLKQLVERKCNKT